MDNQTIILSVSLLLVLVVTGMIAFLIGNTKSSQKKRMMTVIRGAGVEQQGKGRNLQDVRREALAKKLKNAQDAQEAEKKKKSLSESIMLAGLEISVKQFWLYSILLSVVLTTLVILWGKGPFVIMMTAVIGLLGLPRFVLKRMALSRQKQFMADFADVLESMVRLLKAGMPVSEAVKMVAREYTGPVAEEMGRIFDRQKIGVSLPDAMNECAQRIPLPEVAMVATAISIQAQTGSSLSEVFENLSRLIRARMRLRRKVQAVSSEAKSSALIIGCLPVFVASGMYAMNPDYMGVLFTTPTGKMLLTGAIFWMSCGIMVMRQMINFKV
jgi:tight adherence protein B